MIGFQIFILVAHVAELTGLTILVFRGNKKTSKVGIDVKVAPVEPEPVCVTTANIPDVFPVCVRCVRRVARYTQTPEGVVCANCNPGT